MYKCATKSVLTVFFQVSYLFILFLLFQKSNFFKIQKRFFHLLCCIILLLIIKYKNIICVCRKLNFLENEKSFSFKIKSALSQALNSCHWRAVHTTRQVSLWGTKRVDFWQKRNKKKIKMEIFIQKFMFIYKFQHSFGMKCYIQHKLQFFSKMKSAWLFWIKIFQSICKIKSSCVLFESKNSSFVNKKCFHQCNFSYLLQSYQQEAVGIKTFICFK